MNYDDPKKNEKKTKVKTSILVKLLAGIAIPLICILLLMGVFLDKAMEQIVTELNDNNLTTETKSASKQVEAYFQQFIGMTDAVVNLEDTKTKLVAWEDEKFPQNTKAHYNVLKILDNLQISDSKIASAWIYDENKKLFLQTGNVFFGGFDATERPWYKAVTATKDTIITGAYEDITNGELIVTVAAPISYGNGIDAILGLDIKLQELMGTMAEIKIGKEGYVTVFDADNNVLYHPDDSLIMKNAGDINYSDNVKDAILNDRREEGMNYTRNDKNYACSIEPMEDISYLVMGILPQAEYEQYVKNITRKVAGLSIAGIIILTGFIAFVSVQIVKSIRKLSTAAARIAEGELDVRTEIKSSDEVGALAKDINAITDRLKKYILYIDEISDVLKEIGQGNFVFTLQQDYKGEFAKVKNGLLEVRDTISETLKAVVVSADQVASGADQVSIGAQSQAQGATEQASSVQELAATLQDVSTQIDSNTMMIEQTAEIIGAVATDVHDGEMKMQEMLEAMEAISINSQKVGNIIKSIEDIAFQTNILALNAAVEAARAGEAGKGFAVVADEVRSLAGKTAEASETTAELIQKALDAVENGKTIADKTADSFEKVYHTISDIVDNASVITENSEKQNDAIKQTTIGVDQISSVVQTNSATSEESAAASEELSGQAQILKDMVSKFKLPGDDISLQRQRSEVNEPVFVPDNGMKNSDKY